MDDPDSPVSSGVAAAAVVIGPVNEMGVQLLRSGFETCFGWDPRHPRRWDPIAKHISNPDLGCIFTPPPKKKIKKKKRGGGGRVII